MSSTLEDALAQLIISDPVTFASLPLPLAQRIFLALPADARGRASCVCRAWRDVMTDPSLWTCLVVRPEWRHVLRKLYGAAGRARGELRHLDLSQEVLSQDELVPLLTAFAGNLRELHLENVYVDTVSDSSTPTVKAIVAAAPLLQSLTVKNVCCSWDDAPLMLRAEPFPTLHIHGSLLVNFDSEHIRFGGMERVAPFASALADATLQPALQRLCVSCADTAQPAVMGALVDAALALRLRELAIKQCTPPAVAPLARLLTEGSLAGLELGPPYNLDAFPPQFDAAGAALVADAMRVNTTLTKLKLDRVYVGDDMHAPAELLGALAGHPSLRELRFSAEYTPAEHSSAVGAALAALIAADSPALHILKCSHKSLGDAGLAPIVDALALNRHLRELDLCRSGMSAAFARERLLPAVRANTTLRALKAGPSAVKAEELVRGRGQHD